MKSTFNEIMKNVYLAIILTVAMMILEGFFQSRTEYYNSKIIKKHDISKAKKLMHLNFELVESDELQNKLSELQHLEATGIHYFASFGRNIGIFYGALIGTIIASAFSLDFFKAEIILGGISNHVINIFFIFIFIVLNAISIYVTTNANRKTGIEKPGSTREMYKYIRSYLNIIYNYRVGKDIKFYSSKLVKHAGEVYKDTMYSLYASFWSIFGKGITVSGIFNDMLSVSIFIFVALKAVYGSISPGELMLYIGTINHLLKNITELMSSLSILISSDIYRIKLFDFFDLENYKDINKIQSIDEEFNGMWEIEVKNLSFKYPGSDKYVLRNINLKIKKGDILALVGMNGSGKTTLINLILGLYKPTKGQIFLNGKDIQNFSKEAYFKAFSVVFQDFKLLALPLSENVASSKNYDCNKLKESLNKVGLNSFLEKNDLDTYLYREVDKNGIEVSGGEAQKISMARALYKNSPFYILDEPTAALDPISEFEIYSKFNHMIENKTAIYISHRLSSCQFCDTICVLDEGLIIQKGTHEELIKKIGEKYYELWYSQAKHYQ